MATREQPPVRTRILALLRGVKRKAHGRSVAPAMLDRERVVASWRRATPADRLRHARFDGDLAQACYQANLKLLMGTLVQQRLGVPSQDAYELLEASEFTNLGGASVAPNDEMLRKPDEFVDLLDRHVPGMLSAPRQLSQTEKKRVFGGMRCGSWRDLEHAVGSLFEQAMISLHIEWEERRAQARADALLRELGGHDRTPGPRPPQAASAASKRKKRRAKAKRQARASRRAAHCAPTRPVCAADDVEPAEIPPPENVRPPRHPADDAPAAAGSLQSGDRQTPVAGPQGGGPSPCRGSFQGGTASGADSASPPPGCAAPESGGSASPSPVVGKDSEAAPSRARVRELASTPPPPFPPPPPTPTPPRAAAVAIAAQGADGGPDPAPGGSAPPPSLATPPRVAALSDAACGALVMDLSARKPRMGARRRLRDPPAAGGDSDSDWSLAGDSDPEEGAETDADADADVGATSGEDAGGGGASERERRRWMRTEAARCTHDLATTYAHTATAFRYELDGDGVPEWAPVPASRVRREEERRRRERLRRLRRRGERARAAARDGAGGHDSLEEVLADRRRVVRRWEAGAGDGAWDAGPWAWPAGAGPGAFAGLQSLAPPRGPALSLRQQTHLLRSMQAHLLLRQHEHVMRARAAMAAQPWAQPPAGAGAGGCAGAEEAGVAAGSDPPAARAVPIWQRARAEPDPAPPPLAGRSCPLSAFAEPYVPRWREPGE